MPDRRSSRTWPFVATLSAFAMIEVSCATLVNGRYQTVKIDSTPPSCVTVYSGKHGTQSASHTPAALDLRRDSAYTVVFEQAGYRTEIAELERHLSGWVWLNLLTGGVVGAAIDAATAGAYELSPASVSVSLTASEPDSELPTDGGTCAGGNR